MNGEPMFTTGIPYPPDGIKPGYYGQVQLPPGSMIVVSGPPDSVLLRIGSEVFTLAYFGDEPEKYNRIIKAIGLEPKA